MTDAQLEAMLALYQWLLKWWIYPGYSWRFHMLKSNNAPLYCWTVEATSYVGQALKGMYSDPSKGLIPTTSALVTDMDSKSRLLPGRFLLAWSEGCQALRYYVRDGYGQLRDRVDVWYIGDGAHAPSGQASKIASEWMPLVRDAVEGRCMVIWGSSRIPTTGYEPTRAVLREVMRQLGIDWQEERDEREGNNPIRKMPGVALYRHHLSSWLEGRAPSPRGLWLVLHPGTDAKAHTYFASDALAQFCGPTAVKPIKIREEVNAGDMIEAGRIDLPDISDSDSRDVLAKLSKKLVDAGEKVEDIYSLPPPIIVPPGIPPGTTPGTPPVPPCPDWKRIWPWALKFDDVLEMLRRR